MAYNYNLKAHKIRSVMVGGHLIPVYEPVLISVLDLTDRTSDEILMEKYVLVARDNPGDEHPSIVIKWSQVQAVFFEEGA